MSFKERKWYSRGKWIFPIVGVTLAVTSNACDVNNSFLPPDTETPDATKVGTAEIPASEDYTETIAINADLQEIIEQARQKNGGIFLLTVEGYDTSFDFLIKLTNLHNTSIKQSEYDEQVYFVNRELAVNNGPGPINLIFFVPFCEEQYQLYVSFDNGQTFNTMPMTSMRTGRPQETFSIPPETCFLEATIYLNTNNN